MQTKCLTEAPVHGFDENFTNVVHDRRNSAHVQAPASYRIVRHAALCRSVHVTEVKIRDTYTCVGLSEWSMS